MKKIKIVFAIVIIVAIVLVLLIGRKVIIFNDIQKKAEQYEQYNNIYSKTESEISTWEKYILGNSSKIVVKYKNKPITAIQIRKQNEEKMYVFYEPEKRVTITKNTKEILAKIPVITNYASTKSIIDKLFKSKVYTEKIESKEYYVIDSLTNDDFLHLDNVVSRKVYIEKETGLPCKIIETTKESDNSNKEHIVNLEYDFNVTNDVFEDPDVTGYKTN